jgi:hypothetical protein
MLTSVEFYYQSTRRAAEINYVRSNRELATKTQSVETPSAQPFPQKFLHGRLILAQFASTMEFQLLATLHNSRDWIVCRHQTTGVPALHLSLALSLDKERERSGEGKQGT